MSIDKAMEAAARLALTHGRIERACQDAGRDPATVRLLAVGKGHPAAAIRALVAAGQRAFGESWVQEAVAKQVALADCAIEWHFIGPIQSNKTRIIAERFAWLHSLASLAHAERLARQRPEGTPPLKVLIQVNISGEKTKSGVSAEAAAPLARAVCALPGLEWRGLMAIPAPARDPGAARKAFARMRMLRDALAAEGLAGEELSMGMSDDLEPAVAEGATWVRIGTALFGPRK